MTEQEKKELEMLKRNSPYALPDNPTQAGWTPAQIKEKFYAGNFYLYNLLKDVRKNSSEKFEDLMNNIARIDAKEVDLSGYATIDWVNNQDYLTTHQDISGKLDKSVFDAHYNDYRNVVSSVNNLGQDLNLLSQNKVDNETYQEHLEEYANRVGQLNALQQGINNLSKNKADKSELFSKNYNDLTNKPTIPTNTSQLTNNSGYITKAVNNLENYYKKTETYTQSEIDALISAIPKFKIEVVSSLPTSNISATTVYLKTITGETSNLYEEYIYVNSKWEKLGTQTVDLSGYAKTTDVPTKVSQLSNDSGYLTQHQSLADYAKKSELFSKDYNELSNKPSIPTKLSDLEIDMEVGGSGGVDENQVLEIIDENSVDSEFLNIGTNANFNGTSDEQIPTSLAVKTQISQALANYYTKNDIDNYILAIPKFKIEVVESLPTSNINYATVYLLKISDEEGNLYEEWIYVNYKWELLGTARVNLAGYATKEFVQQEVSKVPTDEAIQEKIDGILGDIESLLEVL